MVIPLKVLLFLGLMSLIGLASASAQGPLPKVVMLGDSLTFGGHWQEYFPGLEVHNLGISGDTIEKLKKRLPQVAAIEPDQIYLLIGINDFGRKADLEQIVKGHKELWATLRKVPQTRLLVIALLPVSETRYPGWNRAIGVINKRLAHEAAANGLTFIDFSSQLADDQGSLRGNFSFDGLHLKAEAYRIWANALEPYLNEAPKKTEAVK